MTNDPHPASLELADVDATTLRRRLDAGEITSVDLVDALLARVAAVDREGVAIGSIAALSADARDVAAQRDRQRARGEVMGPLHGIPVLVKDNIEAVGLPGTAGSTALVGREARDADLVTRLREAGAIVLGSTNLSQWANIRSPNSTSGYSATGGLVANPWALDRSAGGSSSGSGAALAARLAPLAVGTETDGSITCPASLNGVYGLKPTVGRVSRVGVVPISSCQDSPGPMARSLDDLELLLGVLSEPTDTWPPYGVVASDDQEVHNGTAASARDLARAGSAPRLVVATSWRSAHGATDALVDSVVARLRTRGVPVGERDASLPSSVEYEDELAVLLGDLLDGMDAYLAARPGPGVASLADVVAHEDEHADVEQRYFGHEFLVRALSSGGRATDAFREARQRNVHWAVHGALQPLLEDHDVIVTPAYGPAWKSDLLNGDSAKFMSASIMAAAIAGWPILTIPMGLVEGLPVGLSLVGRPYAEDVLVGAARVVDDVIRERGGLSAPAWRAANRG